MKTHITTLNNMAGTASLAHRRVLKVAQSIGCHEMGLSFYPLKPDYAKEIDKRLDGIIAPLNYGDIVIFQYPSWIGVNYDESFVNKIKSYRDTKLIIFVQDIQKLMFDSEQAILDMEIKTLNKADLLILPSKKMHRYLKENGLDEKPVIYQTIGGKVSVFMVNIVSGMMTMFTGKPLEKLALPVAIGVAEIAVMIVLETTEKRIAVQRVSINNIYADKNYIAYKLNPVGATPLMFASAAFLLPQFMCNGLHYLFPDNADIQWWMDNMRLTSPLGIVVYMVIICLLTIIFSMVMLSPGRTADDLLKSGDSIQDIYAGKPTKRYLIGTVLSFSVISSIIICICQGGPLFLQFGGYVDASLAMLPCSIMMTTGLWISLYREAEVYRNMDRYHTFI